jgi:hydroxymethylbilane synthase
MQNAKCKMQNAEVEARLSDFALDLLHVALPRGARVGTSSLRRASQLRALRPDLELRDVRGNVDTRLRKLAAGQYDALILAAAGLDRLGLVGPGGALECDGVAFRASPIPAELMLPAVAQGTLAIECRADDDTTQALLASLDHAPTRAAALAERAFLRRLEGGCQVPIAAFAECKMQNAKPHRTATAPEPAEPPAATAQRGTTEPEPAEPPVAAAHRTATAPEPAEPNFAFCILHLSGLVASLDGATVVRGELEGAPDTAEALGTALAEQLIAQGAGELLAAFATSRV